MPAFAHFDDEAPLTAAMCVSSFLVSVDEDGLLVGRMRRHEAWTGLDLVASPDRAFDRARWVLPAGHVRVGEDPKAAARRIVERQLQAAVRELRLTRVLSYAAPFESRHQDLHWDLCFVYDADLPAASTPPWFSELRRVPLPQLRVADFARGHGEVLRDLGLLPSEP